MSEEDDDEYGFWYFIVLAKPANYFLAKSLGGSAEKQADKAMETLGPIFAILVIVVFILFVLYVIARLFVPI